MGKKYFLKFAYTENIFDWGRVNQRKLEGGSLMDRGGGWKRGCRGGVEGVVSLKGLK